MPFTFLNPVMLFGALGAVVPLVLHLLNMRKVKLIEFSDIKFLEEVQVKKSKSIGLRKLLILLLRMLAIILLAFAAAGPRLAGISDNSTGKHSLIVLLDCSASMQTIEGSESRFEQAVRTASDICLELPVGSEIQVLTVGTSVEKLFSDWVSVGRSASEIINQIQVSDGSADLGLALQKSAKMIATASNNPVDLLYIGDMQFSNYDHEQLSEQVQKLAKHGLVTFSSVAISAEPAQSSVLSVKLPLKAMLPGETAVISAEVSVAVRGQKFRLLIDGEVVSQVVSSVESGAVQQLDFPITVPSAGLHKASVETDSDRLRIDDSRPFVIEVLDEIELLLIHGQDHGVYGRGGWQYLETALEPSEENLFVITSVSSEKVTAGDISAADLVILVDPDPLGRQVISELEKVTTNGGSLLLFLGDVNRIAYYQNTLLPALGQEFQMSSVSRSEQGIENLNVIGKTHPLFSSIPEQAIEVLEFAEVCRYLKIVGDKAAALINTTSDNPALLTWNENSGQVIMFPFNFAYEENSLVANSMFPVLMQRVVTVLVAYGNDIGTVAGQTVSMPLSHANGTVAGSDLSIVLEPSIIGQQAIAKPLFLNWENGVGVLDAGTVSRAGYCNFMSNDKVLGITPIVVPMSESMDLYLLPEQFRDLMLTSGFERVSAFEIEQKIGFIEELSGQQLAPLFLLFCLITLLFEGYLRRRA